MRPSKILGGWDSKGQGFMERHKFWIFLGLAVAMGLCLEYLKTPNPQHTRMAGFGRLNALLDEGRAVVGAPVREDELGIAVASADPNDMDDDGDDEDEVSPADAAKTGVKAADKKADAKKADAKKKKKKKKKKPEEKKPDLAAQQAEALAKAAAAAEEAKRKAAADAANAPQNPGPITPEPANNAGTPPASTSNAAPATIPETAAQWEAYLMTNPSLAKTNHFIQYRKSGLVSSAIFYQVTGAMLADKSTAAAPASSGASTSSSGTLGVLIQSFGVQALSASFDSESFTMLSQYTEVSGADAATKAQAQTALQVYGQLQYVHYLASVLSSSADINTKIEAIKLVQTAAQSAFSTQTQSTGSTTNAAAGAQQTFLPFVAVLQALANPTGVSASGTSSLQSQASGALQTLHSFGITGA